jgi:peptide-methionine (S)-S-oxide reductase
MLKTIILFLLTIMTSFMANANDKKYETAIVAGGCFWGMEELLRGLNGVVATDVGYIGGSIPNPTYALVSTGATNYAEAVEVVFDPQKISYEKILKFFFTIHDSTQLNRQENDVGSQYRSAIFYLNEEQKNVAKSVIEKANKSGVFKKPVVTTVEKAGKFYKAEANHQDYLQKNPYGYTCHHPHKEWQF